MGGYGRGYSKQGFCSFRRVSTEDDGSFQAPPECRRAQVGKYKLDGESILKNGQCNASCMEECATGNYMRARRQPEKYFVEGDLKLEQIG